MEAENLRAHGPFCRVCEKYESLWKSLVGKEDVKVPLPGAKCTFRAHSVELWDEDGVLVRLSIHSHQPKFKAPSVIFRHFFMLYTFTNRIYVVGSRRNRIQYRCNILFPYWILG